MGQFIRCTIRVMDPVKTHLLAVLVGLALGFSMGLSYALTVILPSLTSETSGSGVEKALQGVLPIPTATSPNVGTAQCEEWESEFKDILSQLVNAFYMLPERERLVAGPPTEKLLMLTARILETTCNFNLSTVTPTVTVASISSTAPAMAKTASASLSRLRVQYVRATWDGTNLVLTLRLRNVGTVPIKIIAIEDNFGNQYSLPATAVLSPGQEVAATVTATVVDANIDYAGLTVVVNFRLSDGTTVPVSVYVNPA